MILRVALVCLLALFAQGVGAQVSVSGVSGTITTGNSITITGANFGSGPTVVFFDDFELGTNGATLMTGAGSARVGQWAVRSGDVTYSNASRVSGNLAFRADMANTWLSYGEIQFGVQTTEVFYSWWKYIPAGDNWPGEGSTDGVNWKNIWIMRSGTADNDLCTPVLQDAAVSWVWFGNNTGDLGTGTPSNWMSRETLTQDVKGQWHRNWLWLKGDPTQTGQGGWRYYVLRADGAPLIHYRDNANILLSGGWWERIRINGYGRQTANSHPMFDDVYVARGANARARVEIGNANTYSASTDLTILVPTSWTSNSITATAYLGRFTAGQNAYLYVFDASGVPNSTGFPVTIGGSTPAPVVSALTCNPTTLQAPGTTTCTATASNATNYAWAFNSCGTPARCSTSDVSASATVSCSFGGGCTPCVTASGAGGSSAQYCAATNYLTVRYVKPGGFGAN